VCGALALLLTINERTPQASRIRVIAIAAIVVALVRVGGEWWSPGDNRARGEPSPSETRLAILSWNLETASKSPQDVIDGILDVRQPLRPQVVALQELTPDVAAALEASDEIDQRFPYRSLAPRDDVRGMGILSAIPLEEGNYGAFPMLLTARLILPDGSTLDLVNAHPLPPRISTLAGVPVGIDTRKRDLDLRYVRAAAERAEDEERVLLVGDLNTTPFEPGFSVVADGLRDVHAEVASGTGFTWRPAFLEPLDLGLLRIDHVLAGAALQPVAITEDCSLPGDHCRVTAVVDVPDAD
jgi:endonuclease/exonuclease/phosphatase (EEP) superfamily protein YafD